MNEFPGGAISAECKCCSGNIPLHYYTELRLLKFLRKSNLSLLGWVINGIWIRKWTGELTVSKTANYESIS